MCVNDVFLLLLNLISLSASFFFFATQAQGVTLQSVNHLELHKTGPFPLAPPSGQILELFNNKELREAMLYSVFHSSNCPCW